MKLHIQLCDAKGLNSIWSGDEDFPNITCMSDAAQQLPKHIFQHEGKLYGFHRLNQDGDGALYYERTVRCV